MEAREFEECGECTRLIFPGDEIYVHRGILLCLDCHEEHATVFAGHYLCH